MNRVVVFIVFLVGASSLLGEGNPLERETITMAQLEGGFRALARNHRLEPVEGEGSEKAMSWLDGVVGLKLSKKVEDEVLHFLKSGERRREFVASPELPSEKVRWAMARFLELRGRKEEALDLFKAGQVNEFEKLALARLFWRNGELARAGGMLKEVADWSRLRLELEVINQLDSLGKYDEFLSFLKAAIPGQEYRINCYPLELDLEFHLGNWREALEESGKRGVEWRLAALSHYGEFGVLGKEWEVFVKSGKELVAEELVKLPAGVVYGALKSVLNGGKASLVDRKLVVQALCDQSSRVSLDWLVEWQHFQSAQFAGDLVWVAKKVGAVDKFRRGFLGLIDDTMTDVPGYERALVFAERHEFPSAWMRGMSDVLVEFVRMEPCREIGIQPATDFRQGGSYPVFTDQEECDDLAHFLSIHSRSQWKVTFEKALMENKNFQRLGHLVRLRYFLAGKFHQSFCKELETNEWNRDELVIALEYLRYIAINSDCNVYWKRRMGKWATQIVIEKGTGDDWTKWMERWGWAMDGLGVKHGGVYELGGQLINAVAREHGLKMNEILDVLAELEWERSALQSLGRFYRPEAELKAFDQSGLISAGMIKQRDLDYVVGLTLLTVKERLPVMRVHLPEERFQSSRRLRVPLSRGYSLAKHRGAKSYHFSALSGLLGADGWKSFRSSLFGMAGIPPEGEGRFWQEYYRVFLTGGDSSGLGLRRFVKEWDGDSDMELRLAEIAMEYPVNLKREQVEKFLRGYPPAYLADLAGRIQSSDFKKIILSPGKIQKVRSREQNEGERLLGMLSDDPEFWDSLTDPIPPGVVGLRDEVLNWIADHPRNEGAVSLLEAAAVPPALGGPRDLVERLHGRCAGTPGGRQSLSWLLKRCFLKSYGSTNLLTAKSAYDEARILLQNDPGNALILRSFVVETIARGEGLDLVWEAFDQYIERHSLGSLAGDIDWILVHRKSLEGIPKDEWIRGLMGYFYGKDSELLHRSSTLNSISIMKGAMEIEGEMTRMLGWLKKGGRAGFGTWMKVPYQLMEEGRVEEALAWLELAITRSEVDEDEQLRVGLGNQSSVEDFAPVLGLKEFEEFCRSVAGRLREDLSPRFKLVILIGANDKKYHAEIARIIRETAHPNMSIRGFDSEIEMVSNVLRKHPASATYIVNLEMALFSDPELRVSRLSELVIYSLPARERGAAAFSFWKGLNSVKGTRQHGEKVKGLMFALAMRYCGPEQFAEVIGSLKPTGNPEMKSEKRAQFVQGYPFVSDGNLKQLMRYWSFSGLVPGDAFFPTTPSMTYRMQRLAGMTDDQYLASLSELPSGEWKNPGEMESAWLKLAMGEDDCLDPIIEVRRVEDRMKVNWTLGGFHAPESPERAGVFDSLSARPAKVWKGEIWFVSNDGERRLLKSLGKMKAIGEVELAVLQEKGQLELKVISRSTEKSSEKVSLQELEWQEAAVPKDDMIFQAPEPGPLGVRACYYLSKQILPAGEKEAVVGMAKVEPGLSLYLRSWIFHGPEVMSRKVVFFNEAGEELAGVAWPEDQGTVVPHSWKRSRFHISPDLIPDEAVRFEVKLIHSMGVGKFTPVEVMNGK